MLLGAPAASADRYEASLALEAGGGVARVGERGTQAQQVPAFDVGGRLTHAWSNTLAWDVTLAGTLTQPATKRQMRVRFRLFDDGLGFRYAFTAIPAGQDVAVTDERPAFKPVGAYDAWGYEGFNQERDEYPYKQTQPPGTPVAADAPRPPREAVGPVAVPRVQRVAPQLTEIGRAHV